MQRNSPKDPGRWWTVQRGGGPVVATAIHDGHELRPEVADVMRQRQHMDVNSAARFCTELVLRGVASLPMVEADR